MPMQSESFTPIDMTTIIPTKRLTGNTLKAAYYEMRERIEPEELILQCGYVDEDGMPAFDEFAAALSIALGTATYFMQ